MMKLLTFPQSHLALEEKCVKFGPVYPGMKAVLWVRNDGMTPGPRLAIVREMVIPKSMGIPWELNVDI